MNFMMNGKVAGKVAKATIMLAAAAIIVYAVVEMAKDKPMSSVPTAPMTVGAARFPPEPPVSRPVSTPTMLASKNGLGGGAFVGSQSLKLGGSTFLPGRNVMYRPYDFQTPPPWPLYKPPAAPAPEAPPVPAPAAADPAAPVAPAAVAADVPSAPVAPPAPATASLGAFDHLIRSGQ